LSSRWFSRTFYGLVVILAGILVLYASAPRSLDEDRSTSIYTYAIVNAYSHDPEAFTQGLVYGDGFLYEGTGLWGRSSVRRVDIQSGEVQEVFDLSSEFFGEGITIHGDMVYQVTWRSHVGFIYDREELQPVCSFSIDTEGWGLTHDGSNLILSDGTSRLRFLDFITFDVTRTVEVMDRGEPVPNINELEYVDGEIYANIWATDLIARIDPGSGLVVGWIDLTGLDDRMERDRIIDVLNGIAYDDENDRLYVTGKLWPQLYEIELISAN